MDYLFHTELRKILAAMTTVEIDALATGSCDDFSEYRRRCGYLAALHDVTERCDELRRKLLGAD